MIESIERTMELHASPDRVWRAITEPDELLEWFGDEADIEIRPGAGGWFGWQDEGRYHCVVDVVEPPTRLVWRWARPPDTRVGDTDATIVEWTLTPNAVGGTTLSLVESGFTSDAERRENEQVWTDELTELFAYLMVESLDAEEASTDGDDGDDDDDEDADPLAPGGPPVSPATA